ncbi:hypothetical protein EZI54_23020 [Marinobacter halodurans]|uniref:Uncharacterized protein n=1 Tax=Marinobacter halodurans TaxID=2528979 RepID=A0ABY1ZHL7_9GAMM|nr:hypothetical protein [Marinobacter halodurans]TBW46873.1 hypothetical protein EZI54_23020 [Marinobacter halodurans]
MDSVVEMPRQTTGYYADTAYRPDRIPEQPPQYEDHNQSALGRFGTTRLPWGNTESVVPIVLFAKAPPKLLRWQEKNGDPLEGTGYQGRMDHERLRFAPLAVRFQIVNLGGAFARLSLITLVPLTVVTLIVASFASSKSNFWYGLTDEWDFFVLLFGVPAGIWLISLIVGKYFLKWLLKAGKGPLWELNRRTGMVTVWSYPPKFPFIPRGKPEVFKAPFVEFDAWVSTRGDRAGILNRLHLFHRYSKCDAGVGAIGGNTSMPEPCYALWDFVQNYMDVTQPLPDIPIWEAYRHLDPVTAEHDRQTNRPERYWRDMDDDTFKACEREMHNRVRALSTLGRPNIMAEKTVYASY